MFFCAGNPQFPDAGEGMCCLGAVMGGPSRCTCWRPVYDRRQRKTLQPGPAAVRPKACGDCAFRPDSPERNGAVGYAQDADALEEVVWGDTPFFCHQGIRHPTKYKHPPSGTEIDSHPADYDPPIHNGVPYRANGKPADICAGWDARHRTAMESA